MADEVDREYRNALEDLTENSKMHINFLTMLAEDKANESPSNASIVVAAIEAHMYQAPVNLKLVVLYLVDSIVKNCRSTLYRDQFVKVLPKMFVEAFLKVDERVRVLLFKLRQTWLDVFPPNMLRTLDLKVKAIDREWPLADLPGRDTSNSTTVTSTPPRSKHPASATMPVPQVAVNVPEESGGLKKNIHINPKFLNKPPSAPAVIAVKPKESHPADPPADDDLATRRQAELMRIKQERMDREAARQREQILKKEQELRAKEEELRRREEQMLFERSMEAKNRDRRERDVRRRPPPPQRREFERVRPRSRSPNRLPRDADSSERLGPLQMLRHPRKRPDSHREPENAYSTADSSTGSRDGTPDRQPMHGDVDLRNLPLKKRRHIETDSGTDGGSSQTGSRERDTRTGRDSPLSRIPGFGHKDEDMRPRGHMRGRGRGGGRGMRGRGRGRVEANWINYKKKRMSMDEPHSPTDRRDYERLLNAARHRRDQGEITMEQYSDITKDLNTMLQATGHQPPHAQATGPPIPLKDVVLNGANLPLNPQQAPPAFHGVHLTDDSRPPAPPSMQQQRPPFNQPPHFIQQQFGGRGPQPSQTALIQHDFGQSGYHAGPTQFPPQRPPGRGLLPHPTQQQAPQMQPQRMPQMQPPPPYGMGDFIPQVPSSDPRTMGRPETFLEQANPIPPPKPLRPVRPPSEQSADGSENDSKAGSLPPREPSPPAGEPRAIPPNKNIFVDGHAYEVQYVQEIAVIERSGLPHRIYFVGGSRDLVVDGEAHRLAFDEEKNILIDGHEHRVRFGGPSRELLVDGQPLRGAFGGPPIHLRINQVQHEIVLSGPPPEVKIDPEPDYELTRFLPAAQQRHAHPSHVPPHPQPPFNPPQQFGPPGQIPGLGFGPGQPPMQPQPPFPQPFNQGPPQFPPGLGGFLQQQPDSGASGAPSGSGQLSVGDLLAKLTASGLLTKPAAAPVAEEPVQPQEPSVRSISAVEQTVTERKDKSTRTLQEFQIHDLRVRYTSEIDALYCQGQQCVTCGFRFEDKELEIYSMHLDMHFQENRKNEREAVQTWFSNIEAWIDFEESTEQNEKAVAVSNAARAESNSPDPVDELQSIVAPERTGDGETACTVCGEAFGQFFEHDEDVWKLSNATVIDGKYYHPLCYQDLTCGGADISMIGTERRHSSFFDTSIRSETLADSSMGDLNVTLQDAGPTTLQDAGPSVKAEIVEAKVVKAETVLEDGLQPSAAEAAAEEADMPVVDDGGSTPVRDEME